VHVLGVINAGSAIARENPAGWRAHGMFRGSGTSEATAVASGVAAAYLSSHPDAGVLQVKSALREGASGLRDSRAGAGVLAMVEGKGGHASADNAGEAGFNRKAWQANAWTGVKDWQSQLESMWSGPAWDATSWSATTWSATSWSNSSWSATSWSATSWSRATTWSATSWSATSWSATSWSATSWSAYGWGNS
jgi:serine protease AprX